MDFLELSDGLVDQDFDGGVGEGEAGVVEVELRGDAELLDLLDHLFEDFSNEVHFFVSEGTQDELMEDPPRVSLQFVR